MARKKYIIFISTAILLSLAALTYYGLANKWLKTSSNQPDPGTVTGSVSTAASTINGTQTDSDTQAGNEPESTQKALINSEEVTVSGNTAEYGLKARLCEDESKKTFIDLQFYMDGQSVSKQVEDTSIPELAGAFENRAGKDSGKEAFKIKSAYLNPKYGKLYLMLQGNEFQGFTDTAIYSINLKNGSAAKLIKYPGKYTELFFSKDYNRLAFSFMDPPYLSALQEDSVLEVIDCRDDSFVIKANKDKNGSLMGKRDDTSFIYSYTFISWQSNSIVRLKQETIEKAASSLKPVLTEVLYNIDKNLFANADGTALKDPGTPGSGAVTTESEALKVLKSFYSCLDSEKDYTKAMDLLDDGFRLKLGMLEDFGISEITKNDIKAEDASVYSDILKQAQLDFIVKETLLKNSATIYYYQTLALNEDSKVRQALQAKMVKSGGKWRILSIMDADENKSPFV